MRVEHDFLKDPSHKRLRREIKNISDSYSHPWDVIAELAQNSVDAIARHQRKFGERQERPFIKITLDRDTRTLSFYDNGIGFPIMSAKELIAPHETDKDSDDVSQIGQKGVGLTFAIFSSSKFDIESRSPDGAVTGCVEGGLQWKTAQTDELPIFRANLEPRPADSTSTYTKVTISGIESLYSDGDDIFSLSLPVLEFILRTKTAIGSTKPIFQPDTALDVDVRLTVIGGDDPCSDRGIPFRYMLPTEFLKPNDIIDLKTFKEEASHLDTAGRVKKLRGKCLWLQGSENHNGRDVRYYFVMVPSRNLWRDISDKNNLTAIADEMASAEALYRGGIHICSRGMPSGIELAPPVSGTSGYWPNFYILFEDDRLTFDLGRKSIPGRTQGLLKQIAKEYFQEFVKYSQYVTTDPDSRQAAGVGNQFGKFQAHMALRELPDLACKLRGYRKHPDGQEAGVVALFHELVGSGLLRGYITYQTGYRMTYDMWGVYQIPVGEIGENHRDQTSVEQGVPIVVEFKYKAEDILGDVEANQKAFEDIDLIVCWDLDVAKLKKAAIDVEVLKPEDVFFHGSNYVLSWPGAYNLGNAGRKHVLSLRQFVDRLAANGFQL